MLKIVFMLFILSCASRGLELGEQIPEHHPEFYEGRKMVFAQGGDRNKIVFQNISETDRSRSLANESDKMAFADIKSHIKSQRYSNKRSIASIPKYEEHIVYTAPKQLFNKKRTFKVLAGDQEKLEDMALRYLGSKNRVYELLIHNPHLVKIEKGDVVRIPRREIGSK